MRHSSFEVLVERLARVGEGFRFVPENPGDSPLPIMVNTTGYEIQRNPTYRHFSQEWIGKDRSILKYTLSGSGKIRVGGKEHALRAGELLLLDSREKFTYQIEGNHWQMLWVTLRGGQALETTRQLIRSGNRVRELEADSAPINTLAEIWIRTKQGLFRSPAQASIYAWRLLMEIHESNFPPEIFQETRPEWVGRIEEFLRSRPGEGLSVSDMAQRVGLSRDHFAHQFRAHVGISPAAWLHRLRMDRAAELLAQTAYSVQQIGAECGYPTAPRFNRAFHRIFNTSPLSFRKREQYRPKQ